MNQGQICMSTERIVVDAKVADAFVEKFAAKAKSLPYGDPRSGNVVLGSMVSAEAARRVKALIDDATGKGAALAAGGSLDGTIMPATILDKVTPSMRIYGEESFGPVVTIVRVSGDDEAIRIANDSRFGLVAYLWSNHWPTIAKATAELRTGTIWVNTPMTRELRAPFGGFKESGVGRTGADASRRHFTEEKVVTLPLADFPLAKIGMG